MGGPQFNYESLHSMVFDLKPRTNGESSVVAKVWDAMEY